MHGSMIVKCRQTDVYGETKDLYKRESI